MVLYKHESKIKTWSDVPGDRYTDVQPATLGDLKEALKEHEMVAVSKDKLVEFLTEGLIELASDKRLWSILKYSEEYRQLESVIRAEAKGHTQGNSNKTPQSR